jgi:hypothetical protein
MLKSQNQQIKVGLVAAQIFKEIKWNIQRLILEFFTNCNCFWDSVANPGFSRPEMFANNLRLKSDESRYFFLLLFYSHI